jgi:DNA polymerase III sliding clamp (beta) subunit (PCNA family)
MNLTIDVAILAAEAAWLARLKPGPGFNTVTSAVQVSTLVGGLQLRRTDFDQHRETVIPAAGGGQATVIVEANKLASLLKGAVGNAVIDIDDSGLSIGEATRTVRLKSLEDEFPAWPSFTPTGEGAVVGAKQLARVLTSIGTDDTMPMLTVVAFDGGSMITTDRFRMTRVHYADAGFTTLVPGVVTRAFAGGNEVVTVEPGTGGTDQALVRLSCGGRSIVVGVPDVSFPNWRHLIPADPPLSVMLRRDDLRAAAAGDNVVITVNGTPTMKVCSTDDAGDVEIEQSVPVSMLGPTMDGAVLPFTVKLRTKYLTECLRSITCGAVRFQATAADKPVMVTDVGGAELHLIMPIRTPAPTG